MTNVHRISEHKEKLLQHPATFSFFAIIGIFEMKSLVDAVQFPNIQLLSLFSFHPFHHYFDHLPSTPIVLSHRAFLEKAARSKAKPEMRRACAQPRKAWTNGPTNPGLHPTSCNNLTIASLWKLLPMRTGFPNTFGQNRPALRQGATRREF